MTTYSDSFNRSNTSYPTGLGSIPSGGPTWLYINGSWRINNNMAQTETARSSNPIAAIEANTSDVTVSLDISTHGGDALYFRIVDATNWWRLRMRKWQTTSSVTEYEWRRDYTTSNAVGGLHSHSNFYTTTWHSSSTSGPGIAFSKSHDHGSGGHIHQSESSEYYTGNTRTVSGSTNTYYRLYLERSISGSISTITSTSGSVTKLEVECIGNNIAVYKNGSSTAWYSTSNSTHNTATKHGIGRGESNLNGHAIDNFSVTLSNQAPLAPTLTNPGTLNKDTTNRLQWAFNDPDPFDNQSAFDLEARVQGTSTWTVTESQNTTNTRWDSPSGTFTVDTWEWRVRTYDNLGAQGPWSSIGSFTVSESPDAPTITYPINNGTISQTSDTVTWSITNQDKYQLRVLVDDGTGSPDTENIRFDSGEVTSTGTRSLEVDFPTQQDEHVQVRVEYGGLWSTWSSNAYEVAFIPGSAATIELVPYNEQGAVILQITNPASSGSEPDPISNFVRRRTVSTDWITLAEISPNTDFIDYFVEGSTEYEYSIRTSFDNSTSVESISYFIIPSYTTWFLKDPTDPNNVDIIELFVDGANDLDIRVHEDMAEFNPLGRPYKQIIRDVIRGDEFDITVQLVGNDEVNTFIDMHRRQRILLLQSPIKQWYFSFGKDSIRKIRNTVDNYEHYSFRVIEQPDPLDV